MWKENVTGLYGSSWCGSSSFPGDEVVLIGKQGEEEIKVDELAELAGTIHYEILCGLRRIPRIFIDEK